MVKKKNLEWRDCSEQDLRAKVEAWLKSTDIKNSLIFLEGEMGAGKSTFVREILRVIAPDVSSQGSPTFPLVQTYLTARRVPLYHIDLYRLKSEIELEDSGIEDELEEPGVIVCIEWASKFPDAFAHWFTPGLSQRRKQVYLLKISASSSGNRDYVIEDFSV